MLKNTCAVFHVTYTRLDEAENHPLLNKASSATLSASSTAKDFGRHPGMRRHVHTALLFASQPIV